MSPTIIVHNKPNWHPDVSMPPFALDITILRAIYDAINRLRVAGGRTKRERAAAQAALLKFDDFVAIEVGAFTNAELFNGRLIYIGMIARVDPCTIAWDCRVTEDWRLVSGISRWRVYDFLPLVNPAQIKWQEAVRWMNAVRPYAWHWLEEHQKSACAEGGLGRKRDRTAFEEDFKD